MFCLWCGAVNPSPGASLFKLETPVFSPPDLPEEVFDLISCLNCGSWQINPAWEPEKLLAYFKDLKRWALSPTPEGLLIDPFKRIQERLQEYRLYADFLKKHLKPQAKVLDVGSGSGLMLELLGPDYQGQGLEINEVACEYSRQKNLRVELMDAGDASFAPHTFEALIFNQSLDHLPNPGAFLSQSLKWLKPKGYLIISNLINPESMPAKLYGPQHRLWHPGHRIYLTPRVLKNFLKAYNLNLLRTYKPYWRTPYGGFKPFMKSLKQMILKSVKPDGGQYSPAWPGSVYSIIAQKEAEVQHD